MQRVERSIRVLAPIGEVYRFWRDFANHPRFMENVEQVRLRDAAGSLTHWTLRGPLGRRIEYDARLTQDIPNSAIGWNATDGDLNTTGAVTFADLGSYTDVHVLMQWADVPGGRLGEVVAGLFADPEASLDESLRRFKHLVERRSGPAANRQALPAQR